MGSKSPKFQGKITLSHFMYLHVDLISIQSVKFKFIQETFKTPLKEV